MDVEKVGGTKGPKPSDKKDRSSTPDSEEFRQMMKTGKISETEFEKPKKRQSPKKGGLGAEKGAFAPPTEKKPSLPSPYESYPKSIREEPSEEPTSSQQPQKAKETDKDKKKKKKEDKEISAYQKATLKEAPKTPPKAAKIKAPSPKVSAPKEEKPKTAMPPEIKPSKDKEEKQKAPATPTTQLSAVLQEFPPNIATETQSITAPLTAYLNPEIVPLFQKMVGTIIQIQAKGITTTELMLNSPAFQTSIFYGSSITIEKYSTAPAFNIFLKGPTQAVNMFNENIPNLMDQFKAAKLNVGRLEAEHEKFTFRRKPKTGKKDSESQK